VKLVFLRVESKLKDRFPGLNVKIIKIHNVTVEKTNSELEDYKKEVKDEIQKRWKLEKLKDDPLIRAYRDFFWRLKIDPTKNRPAAEALIRRVLAGKQIYHINTFVDAYNLVSMQTAIPIASFDEDILQGELLLREAKPNEEFLGIAMKKPVILNGGEAVIQDNEKLVAIYPYRDADSSKVTLETKNVLMLMCGAPKIDVKILDEAGEVAERVLIRFCGGQIV
jgi:DNA/RNA-binding domain of Phe-tRNA-synthetase-like protein